jgi:hypothetical protein
MLFTHFHLLRKDRNRRAKPLPVIIISPLVLIYVGSVKSRTVWLHLAEVILVTVASSETLVPLFCIMKYRLENVKCTVQCCYRAYREPDVCPTVWYQAGQYKADRLATSSCSFLELSRKRSEGRQEMFIELCVHVEIVFFLLGLPAFSFGVL